MRMTRFVSKGFAPAAGALVVLLMLGACSRDAGEETASTEQSAAPAPHKHTGPADTIGHVDFQVSCAKAAQAPFDRALGMMHHMMYEQAREGFREIAAAHPDCAMAYWGEASTILRPLWPGRPGPEELAAGWSLTQKARTLGPESERDQLLLAALEAFFREPEKADWWTRIQRWAAGMETAYKAHSADIDTAALYALSRLALSFVAEDRAPLHAEAAKILFAIWEKYPTHPGAVHYTIHANDAEGRATESLDVVGSYGEIAPQVPHALHMPTHIYVRLGKWADVIEWNSWSAAAALHYPAGNDVSMHYLHAVDYKVYGYLQQGDDAAARSTFEEAMAAGRHQPGFVSAFHLATIPARLALERRDWSAAASLAARTPAYQPWDKLLWPEGVSWFARGVGAARSGDLPAASEAEKKLAGLRDQAQAAGEQGFASFIEVDRLILAGWIARADGSDEEAVKLMRAAAKLEGTVEKHPVTPGAVYPPYEALGDLLLILDRPAEALAAYGASDQRWPMRFNTLLGAARAAKAAGQPDVAARHYQALLTVAAKSDRSGIEEAKQFIDARGA